MYIICIQRQISTHCVFRFLHTYRQHDATIHPVYSPVARLHIIVSPWRVSSRRSYIREYYRCISADDIILRRDILLHRHPRRLRNCGILARDELFFGEMEGVGASDFTELHLHVYGDYRRAEFVFPLLKMVGKVTIYLHYIIVIYIHRIYGLLWGNRISGIRTLRDASHQQRG